MLQLVKGKSKGKAKDKCISLSGSFSGGSDSEESACNAGDSDSVPGLGRSPWRREWLPTPVFLPGEFHWREESGGLQSQS